MTLRAPSTRSSLRSSVARNDSRMNVFLRVYLMSITTKRRAFASGSSICGNTCSSKISLPRRANSSSLRSATFMGMTGGSGIGMKDGKHGAWNVYRDTFNAERLTQSNAARRSGSSALLPASLDSSLSSRELNGTTRTQHVTRAYRNSTRFLVPSSEKTRARTFNLRTMSPMVRSLGT